MIVEVTFRWTNMSAMYTTSLMTNTKSDLADLISMLEDNDKVKSYVIVGLGFKCTDPLSDLGVLPGSKFVTEFT